MNEFYIVCESLILRVIGASPQSRLAQVFTNPGQVSNHLGKQKPDLIDQPCKQQQYDDIKCGTR